MFKWKKIERKLFFYFKSQKIVSKNMSWMKCLIPWKGTCLITGNMRTFCHPDEKAYLEHDIFKQGTWQLSATLYYISCPQKATSLASLARSKSKKQTPLLSFKSEIYALLPDSCFFICKSKLHLKFGSLHPKQIWGHGAEYVLKRLTRPDPVT